MTNADAKVTLQHLQSSIMNISPGYSKQKRDGKNDSVFTKAYNWLGAAIQWSRHMLPGLIRM